MLKKPVERVIITGATGIIGIALVEFCLKQGVQVTAIVRPGSVNASRLPVNDEGLQVVECDLKMINRLPDLIRHQVDVFYHLGWNAKGRRRRDDVFLQTQDISITLQAVNAAKALGAPTFIGAGSQSEYGRCSDEPISPNSDMKPEIPYGVAKYTAGKMSALLSAQIGVRHIWARIFSTYGPYDSLSSMIMYVIGQLLNGNKPSLTKCEQYWDYIYSEDVARALYLLGMKGQNQQTYNIGGGKTRQLHEYVSILRDAIDPSVPLGIGEREYSSRQIMYLCADITDLVKDTGFQAEVTFEEGVLRTINWYKSHCCGGSHEEQ